MMKSFLSLALISLLSISAQAQNNGNGRPSMPVNQPQAQQPNQARPVNNPAQAQPSAQVQPANNHPVAQPQPVQQVTRPPNPAQAQPALNIQSSVTAMGNESPMDSLLTEDMIRSLRDPFAMPTILLTKKDKPKTDLELFQIKDFKLNGVISGPKHTKAMITAPNGKTYFISVGDHIGVRDGHVTAIQGDSIKVVEYEVDDKGRRTPEVFQVSINGEVESLSKKEEQL